MFAIMAGVDSIQFNSINNSQFKIQLEVICVGAIPRPIRGNNQYPGELVEVIDWDGVTKYVRRPIADNLKVVDELILIDPTLGIYAKEKACDTIFLERDRSESGVVFMES